MAKSIIIYGVPGGKTRFSQRIADYFDLIIANVQDGEGLWFPSGYLYFSSRADVHESAVEYSRSFQSVADEINAAIPLTDWQIGPPPMVGEWNASAYRMEDTRRWWNGNSWSMNYVKQLSDAAKVRFMKMRITKADLVEGIEWRGLSSEPIKVTE